MSCKRLLIFIPAFIIVGWAAFAFISLRGINSALPTVPDLESRIAPSARETPAAEHEAPAEDAPPMESPAIATTNGRAFPTVPQRNDEEAIIPARERRAPLDVECSMELDGIEERCACGWRNVGTFLSEDELEIGGASHMMEMSDEELAAFADSGDYGYAQFYYAFYRLLDLGDWAPDYSERQKALDRAASRAAAGNDERFETGKQYLIEAIRNQNWLAAGWLSGIYYGTNRVEARAWLLIEQKAGGKSLERRELREGMGVVPDPYTDFEREQSEIRATQIIAETDLARHFHPPEICLVPR